MHANFSHLIQGVFQHFHFYLRTLLFQTKRHQRSKKSHTRKEDDDDCERAKLKLNEINGIVEKELIKCQQRSESDAKVGG